MKTAILVDGGFYRRRAQTIWGNVSPEERAAELFKYCKNHLNDKYEKRNLYRIFYYDCPPMRKKLYHPFLKQQVDYAKSDLYVWTVSFFNHLKSKRKLALRMGKLAEEQAYYTLTEDTIKKICTGRLSIDALKKEDFRLRVEQKGVDMRIGLDISSLTFKKQVEQIVLISGDSDFVPAAKLARREGVDFILDPLGAAIKPELYEHIDGLKTYVPNKKT